jgi:hypothetical protein
VEKPPQAGDSLIRASSFSYGLVCENLPVSHYNPPLWTAQSYNTGVSVTLTNANGQPTYWVANTNALAMNKPGNSAQWTRMLYPQELDNNLRELRLTFLWPLLPNSQPPLVHYGTGYQTYRAMIAGQMALDTSTAVNLYFFQSQTFTNAP